MLVNMFSLEGFSTECRKTKTKVIALTNHNRNKKQNEHIKNRSNYKSFSGKRGKTNASKSRLVLVELLIGRESGANF